MSKASVRARKWAETLEETGFADLQTENEELRKALRRSVGLAWKSPPPKPPVPTILTRKGKAHRRYIVIPDTQAAPGDCLDNMDWAGRYIAEKRPDVIVHLGDNWDFPSLSSHDSPVKKAIEFRDWDLDVKAGNEALERMTSKYRGIKGYAPEEHFLFGNHEDRLRRTLEDLPWFRGALRREDLNLSGWNVHEFLETVELDGVLFSHYFANPLSGHPVGGTAHNLLRHVGKSCVMGHRQVLDCAVQQLPDGTQRRATICGAYYIGDQGYKGPQGNGHFRELIVMNEVRDGMWDQLEVSIGYLGRKYG